MINRSPYLCLLLFSLSFLVGCEAEYPWNIQETTEKTMVVDGIVTNELKPQRIKLSVTNPKPNMPASPLSGAMVTVTDGAKVFTFSELASTPGTYISLPFQAVIGKAYSVKITYQTREFAASDSMVPVTPPVPFKFDLDSISGLYSYQYPNYGEPTMVEATYNWATNSVYAQKNGSTQAKQLFYVLKNVDVNKEFGPEKELVRFPAGTKVVRVKYSLSPAHQAFIRSLLMETDWRGGLFDVQPGNVATNLSNGALGFFGTCSVLRDSMVVE